MELRQLRYFVVVAGQRSFSRAAATLGMAQPALSHHVKRLEVELGVELFDRSSRPVGLTEAGQAFLARAERMVAEANLAQDEMRDFAGLGRGQLVIGALPTIASRWLPPVLARFHALHPGIQLVVREANTEELARLLALGQLDVAVLHSVPGMHTGQGQKSGLVMDRLFVDDLVVIAAPGHPLAGRGAVELGQLRGVPFVTLAGGSGLAHTIMTGATAEGFTPDVVAECTSQPTLRALVAAGLGVSIVSRLTAEAAGPPVAVLSLRPALPAHTAAVSWRGDTHPSAAVEAMLALVRDRAAASRQPD